MTKDQRQDVREWYVQIESLRTKECMDAADKKFIMHVVPKDDYDAVCRELDDIKTAAYKAILFENDKLKADLATCREALEKIADPRKRDHQEPDDYTRLGCVMHIAQEALEKLSAGEGE